MTIFKLLFNSRNHSDCYHCFFYYLKRIILTHKCNYFSMKFWGHKTAPSNKISIPQRNSNKLGKSPVVFLEFSSKQTSPAVCLYFIFSSSFFGIECFSKKEGFLFCIFLPLTFPIWSYNPLMACMKRIRNMSSLIAGEDLKLGWAGEAGRWDCLACLDSDCGCFVPTSAAPGS